MPNKKTSKTNIVVLTATSEDVDTSESEDELKKAKKNLHEKAAISDQSSSSEPSDAEEKIKQHASKSKKKKRTHWVKKPFAPPLSTFSGNMPPPPITEPKSIDYFYEMFGKESFQILKEQSNLYSAQVNPNRPADITETEIHQFIGILLMTGVYAFPEQRFFWTGSTRVESIASVMSRDRFLEIKKWLHVVDNTDRPDSNDPNYDRAYKVRPLLNIVKENFRRIPKEEHLSVDEQIIPFKGKSIMKQHMPNKPDRWGYKMFLLAGGSSGICYDFVFYTGKSNKSKYGFCTDIVLDLCETVPPMMNYKLYYDNYFTTIRLQVELMKLGIFSVGTVRANRLPDLTMKDDKRLSSEGRGSMDHRITEIDGIELCATRWYDNNSVNCLSTLYGGESVDLVKRWSAKEKKHIQVKRPDVIKAYNEYMGGVDLMDMLISLYRINIRSKKYYIKIVLHLIDLSLVNAWLLYRRHCFQHRLPKNKILSLLQFRVEIAEGLLKAAVPKPPVQRGRPKADLKPKNQDSSSKRPRAAPVRLPSPSTQHDRFDHWPMSTIKGRCRFPGCNGRSTIICSKCKVRLCLTAKHNCFKAYHMKH